MSTSSGKESPASADVSESATTTPIRTVSIIGAGQMGRGIAAANLRAGIPVCISDINPDAANEAVQQVLAEVSRQTTDRADKTARLLASMIRVASDLNEAVQADLVIEAIAERQSTKTEFFDSLDPHLPERTIIATNSSSIPLKRLVASFKNQTRFCGLHFCHPVHERPLVEVVGAEATSRETLRRVWSYLGTIGMAPVIVRDGPGFVLNRLLMTYYNEVVELLFDGAELNDLDRAALEFGMPAGPLEQLDEYGVDVALAVARTLFWSFPSRIVPSELLIRMFKTGRLGRKSGSGFYVDSPDGDGKVLDPFVVDILTDRRQREDQPTFDEIQHRMFLPMLVEATRLIEDRFVESASLIDIVLNDGVGMTGQFRGLFAWADSVGADRILELLHQFEPLGKRFEPTQLLLSRRRF